MAHGITFVYQGNRFFADLTVMESLEIGGYLLPHKRVQRRIAQALNSNP